MFSQLDQILQEQRVLEHLIREVRTDCPDLFNKTVEMLKNNMPITIVYYFGSLVAWVLYFTDK